MKLLSQVVLLAYLSFITFEDTSTVLGVSHLKSPVKISRLAPSSAALSSILLLSSLMLPQLSSRASATVELTLSEFYERFKYEVPSDILSYIRYRNIQDGDTVGVIDALDEFSCYYPMYKLSREKAVILQNQLIQYKPKNILEIGSFFGYSALNMMQILSDQNKNGDSYSVTCIEANPLNCDVMNNLLDKGLTADQKSHVKLINGLSTPLLLFNREMLTQNNPLKKFDFVFLDHDKDCYMKDLKLLEDNDLISSNCIIVADNVIYPGAPGYLEYVGVNAGPSEESISRYKTTLISSPFERIGYETKWKKINDAMSVSIKQV